MTLRVRWLGTVAYRDAHAVQSGLVRAADDWLLLMEHPPTYSLGVRADPANLLRAPAEVGAEVVRADRGGDVTFHGPGQLVGYPILSVPGRRGGGMTDTVAYVHTVEAVIMEALTDLGLADVGRVAGRPGVWVGPDGPAPRKIAAVGVRLTRGRSMHGFALNVDTDMTYFDHIVPCGISDMGVTSLAGEGIAATMREVVDAVAAGAVGTWGTHGWERSDVVWRHRPDDLSPLARGSRGRPVAQGARGARGAPVAQGARGAVRVAIATTPRRLARLAEAGTVGGLGVHERKPGWLRAPARMGAGYLQVSRTVRELGLVTVCQEAGCPNIFECWADGTATFMLNGERCTRACGFCLVDTRHPEPVDPTEPDRVAEAVDRMGLDYAVLTAVARDDLADGGASGFVGAIRAIRRRSPATSIEVLIPDCKSDPEALASIFDARPDVLNHNIETVARLQRAVRPSASYGRSLAVLARAKTAGLTTKSGLMVGLGETDGEIEATFADLHGIGVDIVTVGQYLRPTASHLPVARWLDPGEFARLKQLGESMGLGHVEASPLTRSSYHAKLAASRT